MWWLQKKQSNPDTITPDKALEETSSAGKKEYDVYNHNVRRKSLIRQNEKRKRWKSEGRPKKGREEGQERDTVK